MINPNNFKKYSKIKIGNILKAIGRKEKEVKKPKRKNTSVKVLETKRNEAQGSEGIGQRGDKIKRGRNGVASTCKKCTKFEVHRK